MLLVDLERPGARREKKRAEKNQRNVISRGATCRPRKDLHERIGGEQAYDRYDLYAVPVRYKE